MDQNQQNLAELRRNNQILQDQVCRLNTELANNEVQRSGLESQLRLAHWPQESSVPSHQDEDILRQLHSVQRERSEMRGKIDSLNLKLRQLETENKNLERAVAKSSSRSKSYERPEKYELDSSTDHDSVRCEQEIRDLRLKIVRLENELSERETEIARIKAQRASMETKYDRSEIERYRSAQLQAERLLEAREQSHRQQVNRLENQVCIYSYFFFECF